eukprot:260481_1
MATTDVEQLADLVFSQNASSGSHHSNHTEPVESDQKTVELVTRSSHSEEKLTDHIPTSHLNESIRSINSQLALLRGMDLGTEDDDQQEDLKQVLDRVTDLFTDVLKNFGGDSVKCIGTLLSNEHCRPIIALLEGSEVAPVRARHVAAFLSRIKWVNDRNNPIIISTFGTEVDLANEFILSLIIITEYIQSSFAFGVNVMCGKGDCVSHFDVISNRLTDIDKPLSPNIYALTFDTIKLLYQHVVSEENNHFNDCPSLELLFAAAHKYKAQYPTQYSHHSSYGKYDTLFPMGSGNNSGYHDVNDASHTIDFRTFASLIELFESDGDDAEEVFRKICKMLKDTNSTFLLSRYDFDRLTEKVPVSFYSLLLDDREETRLNEEMHMIETQHNLTNTALLLSIKTSNSHRWVCNTKYSFCTFPNCVAFFVLLLQIFVLISLNVTWLAEDKQWDDIFLDQTSITAQLYNDINFDSMGNSSYELHFSITDERYKSMVNNYTFTCDCNSTGWPERASNGTEITVDQNNAQAFCEVHFGTNVAECAYDYPCDPDDGEYEIWTDYSKYDSWGAICKAWGYSDPCKRTTNIDLCDTSSAYSCFEQRFVDVTSYTFGSGADWQYSVGLTETLCDDPKWIYGVNESFDSTMYNQYVFAGVRLNWVSANQFCARNYGTSLAVIYDENGNEHGTTECGNTTDIGGCWIGAHSLYDTSKELNSEFKWFDYRPYTPPTSLNISNYSNWDPYSTPMRFQQMTDYVNKDLCGYMAHDGSWTFTDCNKEKHFLCNNPWWYTPWLYYYQLSNDEELLPSSWNNKILLENVNVVGFATATTAIVGSIWDQAAPPEIYFFGVIATLILFTYLLKETTQLSEILELIELSDSQETRRIGYTFYALHVSYLVVASLCSISFIVKSHDAVEVISSVISVLFVLDIDDWIGYFIKHKYHLTADFYIISTDKSYLDDTDKESCCVMAAMAHGWSQIWLMQLWSLILFSGILESECDHSFVQHTGTMGWFCIFTIGVWIVTFLDVDSIDMVQRGWAFSSFVSGWLFLVIYTAYVMVDCHIAGGDVIWILVILMFFALLTGGIGAVLAGVVECVGLIVMFLCWMRYGPA